MALQTNLSKKDKITIAVLLFAAVIFMIAWFLIRPTITSIITTEDKIEQAEFKQTENKNKIMYLLSAEVLYEKSVNDLNSSTADYYGIMDSAEIDKMVTSYVLKSGLFSENLVITIPSEPVDETPYAFSDLAAKKTPGTASASVTSSNGNSVGTLLVPYNSSKSSTKSTKSSGVQRVGLTLVVTGSRKACQAFIDDICTKPAVRISGFSWDKVDMIEQINEQTGMVEFKDPGTVRLRINLYLYMADVADYNATVSDAVNNAAADTEE